MILPKIHSLCALANSRFFWLMPGVVFCVLLPDELLVLPEVLVLVLDSALIGVLLAFTGVDTLLTGCREKSSALDDPSAFGVGGMIPVPPGVNVMTLGHPEVWPDEQGGAEVSVTRGNTALTSGLESSSLSEMVMTSSGPINN